MLSSNRFISISAIFLMTIAFGIGDQHRVTRLLGGSNVSRYELKYIVRVNLTLNNGLVTFCGGSIISARHILTAAHCVHGKKSAVVIAGISSIDDANGVVMTVNQTFPHPDFVRNDSVCYGAKGDVAVLLLNDRLQLFGNGHRFKSISMASAQYSPKKKCVFAGWGRTDPNTKSRSLHKAPIDVVPVDKCVSFPQLLCANSPKSNLCTGDSGAPLVCDKVIYGVASAGCCYAGAMNYYANVYHYSSWIKKIMRLFP